MDIIDLENEDHSDYIRRKMNEMDPIHPGNSTQPIVFSVNNTELLHPVAISDETVGVITKVYTEYNKIYGLNLKVDITSIVTNFRDIIDPHKKKIFEIYLSESFERFRLAIFQKMMISIGTLIEQISVASDDVPVQDKYIMVEKLFQYMDMCNNIYSKIKVEYADTELKRLANEVNDDIGLNDLSYNTEEMKSIIDKLNNTILNKDE